MSFSDTTQAFGGWGVGDFITAMGIDAQVPHSVPFDTQGGGTDWVEVEILAPHMVSTETDEGGLTTSEQSSKSWLSTSPPLTPTQEEGKEHLITSFSLTSLDKVFVGLVQSQKDRSPGSPLAFVGMGESSATVFSVVFGWSRALMI